YWVFGSGRHVYLGQIIAILEIKKLVPALLTNYEVKFEGIQVTHQVLKSSPSSI
ncbi:uncharacterized protein EURHEDRAFT_465209, partial [Aspergillus ruber CBS 135680]